MSSHSVDHLTYTYYTGEDGSIIQGPNCYKCMNELFHAKSLDGVDYFYICTPTGIIPFTLHSLIFFNGIGSPFTMKTIPEAVFVQNCVSCARKPTQQMLSEINSAMSIIVGGNNPSYVQPASRTHEPSVVSLSETPSKRIKLEESSSPIEQDREEIFTQRSNIPPHLVNHISDHQTANNIHESQKNGVDTSERAESRIRNESHCESICSENEPPSSCYDSTTYDFTLTSAPEKSSNILRGDPIRTHNSGRVDHLLPVSIEGQSLSESVDEVYHPSAKSITSEKSNAMETCDLKVTANCLAIIHDRRIPFVDQNHSRYSGMLFGKLFDYLSVLKRSKFLDDGFSDYLFGLYPHLKDIQRCSLCNSSISCCKNADDYLDHFLSSKHIAKAVEKNWSISNDYGTFLQHITSYLQQFGERDLHFLKTKLDEAATDEVYSRGREEYNHLFNKLV